MKNETYNGYTNYETWNCALWLDNDQGTQEAMQEKAEELVEELENPHDADEITGTTSLMADFIKALVDDLYETQVTEASMFSDLLGAAMRVIDYYDIAESQLADALAERKKQEAA